MRVTSTALDDGDDDDMITEDGYAVLSPSFDESEMLEALEDPPLTEPQAALSDQEAYEAMQFQAPLSREERAILATTPGLRGVRWVDDPDHFEWLTQRMRDRHKAMDEVLEDEMYGHGPRTTLPMLKALQAAFAPKKFNKLLRLHGPRGLAAVARRNGTLQRAAMRGRDALLGAARGELFSVMGARLETERELHALAMRGGR